MPCHAILPTDPAHLAFMAFMVVVALIAFFITFLDAAAAFGCTFASLSVSEDPREARVQWMYSPTRVHVFALFEDAAAK